MELPNRKPTRLQGYDYSNQNYYFVTICTHQKTPLFGKTNELNEFGKIAENELLKIPMHFKDVRIDKYIMMPTHIHAVIVIGCDGELDKCSKDLPTLSTVVGLYKSGVSKRIHKMDPSITVWQKSFNDHIIRNEKGYQEVWKYIDENPLK